MSELRRFMRHFMRHRSAVAGLALVGVLVFAGLFGPILSPQDPDQRFAARQPPGAAHVFGTDELGRDLFAGVLHGARVTLMVGFISVGIACDLRWPNDVMIGHKKTAGILAQLIEPAAIAGIGVNVNHTVFPENLADEATSLRLMKL